MDESSTSSAQKINRQDLLIQLAKSKPDGISTDEMKHSMPDLPLAERATIINKCLTDGSLKLFERRNGKLFYKYNDPNGKTLASLTDEEEKVVCQVIEQAANKGICIKTIKSKTNINLARLKKILMNLESINLIKAVTSAKAKTKIYVLNDSEAEISITGGEPYDNKEESEFFEILNQQCCKYLIQKRDEAYKIYSGPTKARDGSNVTAVEMFNHLSGSDICKVPLSLADVERALYTVVADKKAEKIAATDGSFLYRAVKGVIDIPGIAKSMCDLCPVAKQCADSGSVTPINCKYFTEWF